MKKITEFKFRTDNQIYSLGLNWDDASFVDGKVAVNIVAERKNVESGRTEELLSADVSLGISEGEPMLTINLKGLKLEKEFKIPVKDLFDGDSYIEQILEKIPSFLIAGDPIVGCLMRSGLSATIGQIIQCKNDTADYKWLKERMRAIGRCMKKSLPKMATMTVVRSVRCIMKFGF